MFLHASELHEGQVLEADLIIVGTGPAGLTLAKALANTRLQILVLEAGEMTANREVQKLYDGAVAGAPNYLPTESRFRVFGGSTTEWGGQCVPLEDIDFEKRDGIPHSGWPFRKQHLQPYYERAQTFLGIPPSIFDLSEMERRHGALRPFTDRDVVASMIGFAQPLDLGASLKKWVSTSSNVNVVLGANALAVETTPNGATALGIRFKTFSGQTYQARGKRVVLACGGIENARLLLDSTDHSKLGLGNHHDLVGRYFLDHAYLMPGSLCPASRRYENGWHIIETFPDTASFPGGHPAFTLNQDLRRREGLPACTGYFLRRRAWQLRASYFDRGGQALTHFADIARGKRFRGYADAARFSDLVRGLPSTLAALAGWLGDVALPRPRTALRVVLEATPRSDSRITLLGERNRLGQRLPHIDWRLNDLDWRAFDRFSSKWSEAIAKNGAGVLPVDRRLNSMGFPVSMTGGRHHMGTTRMHVDPTRGVVDANLGVHGIRNLYIAGSSVFPTGGWANPTLTIVALSIRLADHLRLDL